MQKAVWAVYYHSVKNNPEELHKCCPSDKYSWCKWQVDKVKPAENLTYMYLYTDENCLLEVFLRSLTPPCGAN